MDAYVRATQGNAQAALELYAWNARVAGACMQDIGHLEVLIRNRYDAALGSTFGDWTDPDSGLWQRQIGVEAARRKQAASNAISRRQLRDAAVHGHPSTRGHIVASLSFGFWTALTRAEREASLWTPCLSSTFSGLSRGQVHDHMVKLNAFRNRLAHWEPVFSRTTGLSRQLQRVHELFEATDSAVGGWVGAHSSVLDELCTAPVSTLRNPSIECYLGLRRGGRR